MSEERRREALTDKDKEWIVQTMAQSIKEIHHCSFSPQELETLRGLAGGVSKTQKIASYMIITAIVGAIITGTWQAVVFYAEFLIKRGPP